MLGTIWALENRMGKERLSDFSLSKTWETYLTKNFESESESSPGRAENERSCLNSLETRTENFD